MTLEFDFSGIDYLERVTEALMTLPDSVLNEMLEAGADILVKAQTDMARSMLVGEFTTGTTASSITSGKKKKSGLGMSIEVYPQGTGANGRPSTEIAFINNYGKKGQPARPFITDANNQSQDKATEAAADVFFKYLDSFL